MEGSTKGDSLVTKVGRERVIERIIPMPLQCRHPLALSISHLVILDNPEDNLEGIS